MFRQSLRVARLQWDKFRDSLLGPETFGEQQGIPAHIDIPSNKLTNGIVHDAIFELNSLRFHTDLFAAAERDPLSTIYSAVWTLCSSLPPPRQLIDDRESKTNFKSHYTGNWYPLLLLQRYVARLLRRDDRDDFELFTIEQLVAADTQYLSSFDEYRALRDFPEKARELYTRYEQEYLTSPELMEMARRTPFGTAERIDRKRVAYTNELTDVRDRRKLANLFYRIRAYEELRSLVERRLRTFFGRDSIHLDQWILAMERANEESIDDDGYDGNAADDPNTQYLMVWQYQKSHLVWFVVHTLFALNEHVADDELTLDLLYFVTNCLERFVECGMCNEHWVEGEAKSFALYEQQFAFAEKRWKTRVSGDNGNVGRQSSQLQALKDEAGSSFTRVQSLLDDVLLPPSMYMIHVHNKIQSENVSPYKRLTRACLGGIREDYAFYAYSIEDYVVQRTTRLVRRDALDRPEDVFANEMLRNVATSNRSINDEATRTRTACDLANERNAYAMVIFGIGKR